MFAKTVIAAAALAASAIAPAHAELKPNDPVLQGISLQGVSLQGVGLNGFTLNGFTLNGFTLNGPGLNIGGHQGISLNGEVIAIEL